MANNASHEWLRPYHEFHRQAFLRGVVNLLRNHFLAVSDFYVHVRASRHDADGERNPFITMSHTEASGQKSSYPNPFLWVPSSYLAMGLIYVTVGSVANVMFKNMGMDNVNAAFWSSMLGFPYTFKFVWAPLLELY